MSYKFLFAQSKLQPVVLSNFLCPLKKNKPKYRCCLSVVLPHRHDCFQVSSFWEEYYTSCGFIPALVGGKKCFLLFKPKT